MPTPHDYATQHEQKFIDELKDWLRIPSVSTDPTYIPDVQRAAEWLASNMQQIGLENIQILPTGGHPVVYADWLHAGDNAPTVLVYGHYDVQPAVIEDGWNQDPFEPVIEGKLLIARGATDDKGQTMIQLKAAESLLSGDNVPPVNLKYLIEGEEEIGSKHLADFIQSHTDLLSADVCVISDTGIENEDQPLMVYALRGMVTMTVTVQGAKQDLHSGGYGGIIHNPVQVLAEIVSKLHNEDGSVAVPGFYDSVAEIPASERAEINKVIFDDNRWRKDVGAPKDWGEAGYTRTERIGIRPTLEINGFAGGYAGEGFKTVLPAKATAKISCRLVPDQDSKEIFKLVENHIRDITPETVTITIEEEGNGDPAVTPLDHPSIQSAINAYRKNWENPPVSIRHGGSIPVVVDIQKILGLPVVLLGFGLPDSRGHGPNETFNLNIYQKGISTVIDFMDELAQSS